MCMPEAAVHKYNFVFAGENDVRFAAKIPTMQTKAETHTVDDGAHDQLRGGVFALDSRHIAASLFAIVNVRHVIEF
jgi:hypothetical protein